MTASQNRYLAFSGGGFNTHSMLAGMIAGAIDSFEKNNRIRDLDLLMRHIDGISSNSGGSWFLSQLAYSDQFKSQFEADQQQQYNKQGYNGQISNLWKGISLDSSFLDGIKNFLPTTSIIYSWLKLINNYGLDWVPFNDQFTYQPFGKTPMHSELEFSTLSSERLPWANDKDLVTAVAVQTKPVVLDEYGWLDDKIFSSVKPSDAGPHVQASPLGLVSDYKEELDQPVGMAKVYSGEGVIKYETNEFSPRSATAPLNSEYDANNLGVFEAALASSSAAALLAAPSTFESISSLLISPIRNELSARYSDLSPWASFNNHHGGRFDILRSARGTGSISKDFSRFKTEGFTRLADGGYVDNTSAAFMLNHLQSEDQDSGFHMTIFANTSDKPSIDIVSDNDGSNSESYSLTKDVSSLFGNSDGNNSDGETVEPNFFGVKLKVPSPKIFESDAWLKVTEPTWRFSKENFKVDLFTLDVTTVDNKAFGIKGGQNGVVDIYLASNTDGFAAPITNGHLEAYADNYSFYREAILEGGGYEHIRHSFGIKNDDIPSYEQNSRKHLLDNSLTADQADSMSAERTNINSYSSRLLEKSKLVGTDEDDIIQHHSGRFVTHGGAGADLHLLFKKHDYSGDNLSLIKDISNEDSILLDKKSFGKKISFEIAESRGMLAKLKQSDVDFVYKLVDRGSQNEAVGHLYHNQNGSGEGWGENGGLLAKLQGSDALQFSIGQMFYF